MYHAVEYVCRNLTRPVLVENLAKGIVDLCTSPESGDGMLDVRKKVVSGLIVSLLDMESTADSADSTADNVSKGLRKVNNSCTAYFLHRVITILLPDSVLPDDFRHWPLEPKNISPL